MCRDCNKKAVLQAVESLRPRRYGWDGKDALSVRPDAYVFCLFLFGPDSELCLSGLGMPDVVLNTDGTIEVTFAHQRRELVLTFATAWVVTFIQVFEDGETTVEGVISYDREEDCRRFSSLLRWIKGEAKP